MPAIKNIGDNENSSQQTVFRWMSQPLSSLKPEQRATIVAVHAEEALFHRLSALGFRVGKSLRVVRRGAFLGPLQVRVGSTDVVIRRRDAATIEVALVGTTE